MREEGYKKTYNASNLRKIMKCSSQSKSVQKGSYLEDEVSKYMQIKRIPRLLCILRFFTSFNVGWS